MTTVEKVARRKLRLLELASEMQNVSKAFALSLLIAIYVPVSAQGLEQEASFLAQYEQFAARTEFTSTKVNSFLKGPYRDNRDVALALAKEVVDLREQLGQMLSTAGRYNISLQSAGLSESRSVLYMTEAGNAMFSELGIIYISINRNEAPLDRALVSYRAIKTALEREFRKSGSPPKPK